MKPIHHALLAVLATTPAAYADWKDEIGFTRLQSLAGPELPGFPSGGVSQIEAPESGKYKPDPANSAFSNKTFVLKSGASSSSSHATHVALNFYGSGSQLPGLGTADIYEANDWLQGGFLNLYTGSAPQVETRAVQNHSWAGSVGPGDEEVGDRIDFAINRDGFICAVGSDNAASTNLPELLCQSYHTISVGRDDGGHSAGTTTVGTNGRIKPDIVAPSAAPEYASSWTTPMVAGSAGLLVEKISSAPYSLTGADKPRVIKALLLASATKNTVPGWANTGTRPLDLIYGAGELNVNHAYNDLRAGRVNASNIVSHGIRAWAAESVSGNSTKTYFLTIPPGAPATPFCAAMTWHRVITDGGAPGWGDLSSSLANLNLRLYQASGFTTGSLLATSASAVDNVELVHQAALVPGEYALVVENLSATATAFGLAWHSLPAVTVAATVSMAREIDAHAGQITVTRTGDTTLPLFVPLSIGGTATAGTHYTALPASITIPAGQSSVTLAVNPVSDLLAQGDRSIVVSVASDFGLVRDAAQSAVVTLEDKPFDDWRFTNFTGPELALPLTSGEHADPDADGLENLVEYALASDPNDPGGSPIEAADLGGFLGFSVSKNPVATDVTWDAEVSGDLITWTAAVIVTNNPSSFVAVDSLPFASPAPRFMRLKIVRP